MSEKKTMSPAEFDAFVAKAESEFEARIAALRQKPECLSRDCEVAKLTDRLRVMKMYMDQIRNIDGVEAFGGPVPLDPDTAQVFLGELEDALAATGAKPH